MLPLRQFRYPRFARVETFPFELQSDNFRSQGTFQNIDFARMFYDEVRTYSHYGKIERGNVFERLRGLQLLFAVDVIMESQ